MYINTNVGLAQSADASTAPSSSGSAFQQIQNALMSGQWYLALTLAVLTGLRDENKLTNMVFFARHPERGGRKLEKSETGFARLSQEWVDIRNSIVRPFLQKSAPGKPSTVPPVKPAAGSQPYPEVNTPLPASGPGYKRRHKGAGRSYGLPEMIQALTEIAANWQSTHPNGPRILYSDISRQGGGKFKPHSSHRVGLDVDLRLENGRSAWYEKEWKSDGSFKWKSNPKYSRTLTQELSDVFNNYINGTLKVKFILFDDPQVSGVKKDKSSPHLNHFHVRFCAPAYFAAKVDKRYQSCS
jgi:hypothetical protein